MLKARSWYIFAYVVAIASAVLVAAELAGLDPLWRALAADVAATVVIFGFSRVFDNSSFYDAYWSVAPIALAWFWARQPVDASTDPWRAALVMTVLVLWGVRLSYNFWRSWRGLDHEDWRYVDLRQKTKAAYWVVSFFGLHLLQTLIVFGCMVPLFVVVTGPGKALGLLDAVAGVITFGAVLIESIADAALVRYRRSEPPPSEFLATGIWAWSRHPNYFGELGFWWGIWLFAVAADWGNAWTAVFPALLTAQFHFISIPMIEARMVARRPGYQAHTKRVSRLVLWPPEMTSEPDPGQEL